MPIVQCPQCRKPQRYGKIADLKYFPFCSERCKLIDLGAWLDEEHRIPGDEPGKADKGGGSPSDGGGVS